MLEALRDELKQLTLDIISELEKRRRLVEKLQKNKDFKPEFKNFDPIREKLLFNSLKNELNSYSIKDLLIISLIIESQAGDSTEYPSWSCQVHLNSKSQCLSAQINPILLATFYKSSYDALQINTKFSKLINPL